MKVSVVVPVWNPGPNIQRCIDGLLGQTMPAGDYEIVFVDDGSTDGTGALLDDLAAQHPDEHVRVVHIPNSGWPGKPRNVGVSVARGEYVHFVDNDDTLAPEALEWLYEIAGECDADIVIGKPASNFRYLNHRVYRRNVLGTTLAESPWLVDTLTPHKMFRRSMLLEHDVRHPEGPVPFEDQMFVMRAYLPARSIAVLADRPCYFYMRRIGSGQNAGDRPLVPVEHCRALGQVLDIVDGGVNDPVLRDRLLRRFYRTSVLGPLVGPAMLGYADDFRTELMRELRTLAGARFGPGVRGGCGAATRSQGRHLLENDAAGLMALAEAFRHIGLRVESRRPRWHDGVLSVDLDGLLVFEGEPLVCEAVDGGWALPERIVGSVPVEDRLLEQVPDDVDLELSVVSRVDEASFPLTDGLGVAIDDDGAIRVRGTVAVDPRTAMGGRPLADGIWDLRVRLAYEGINRMCPVRPPEGDRPALAPYLVAAGTPVVPYWTDRHPALALDVGEWGRSLADLLAPDATLTVTARGSVQIGLALDTAPDAVLPTLEVLFRPIENTPGGLITVPATLARESATALSATVTPDLVPDGAWRMWLSLTASARPPAARLPWVVRASAGALRVEPAAD